MGKQKFKQMFSDKVGQTLDGFTVEKLQSILVKITNLQTKITANTNLDATKKARLLDQVGALLELVQQKIDDKNNGLDINALLQ
jgi:hypothetical protein